MAQFIVSANQLTQKKDELSQKKKDFENVVNQLESESNKLDSMWDGEAKKAFKTSMAKDIAELRKFIAVLNDFIKTLDSIIQQYRQTEQKNINLATS